VGVHPPNFSPPPFWGPQEGTTPPPEKKKGLHKLLGGAKLFVRGGLLKRHTGGAPGKKNLFAHNSPGIIQMDPDLL